MRYQQTVLIYMKGMNYMVRKIRLSQADVERFVAVASKCDFDIDIAYNRYVVDAKSILGVFGMDFSKVLTVEYEGYHAEFENMMATYTVAC